MEAIGTPGYFFDLGRFAHAAAFAGCRFAWEVLPKIRGYIEANLRPAILGEVMPGAWVSEEVYLAPGCIVEPGALVRGPAIIGPGTVIRQGAYIREYCLVGERCLVGHATELKGSIMLDHSQAPHFNYAGDSVLGNGVNLGAGTKLSNVKNDFGLITVRIDGVTHETGLRKFGAIVGDDVHTGCNSVSSPGTLVGPRTLVYANAVVRGSIPPDSIVKLRQTQEIAPRR